MNTKILKLRGLLKESQKKGEIILINVYNSLLSKMNDQVNNDEFDEKIIFFLDEKAVEITKLYKRKLYDDLGKEIYCVLIIVSSFLRNKYKAIFNFKKNKFELIEI